MKSLAKFSGSDFQFRAGFTLVELLISLSLFSLTMVVITSSLLTMVDANRKGQAVSTVMNNLNFALESITRNARTGTAYLCGASGMPTAADCPAGGKYFGFTNSAGNPVFFRVNNSKIERCMAGASCTAISNNWLPMTGSEITVDSVDPSFYLFGTPPYGVDNLQPRMVMVIQGNAVVNGEQSAFNIQTSVVQRTPDR